VETNFLAGFSGPLCFTKEQMGRPARNMTIVTRMHLRVTVWMDDRVHVKESPRSGESERVCFVGMEVQFKVQ
jgi:hypothetical protein